MQGIGSSLSEIFSAESKDKFSRAIKPAEYVPKPKPVTEAVKEKKRKWKKEDKEKQHTQGVDDAAKDEESGEIAEGDNKGEDGKEARKRANNRTVFIGNIPLSESVKSIRKLCTEFGEVESVRLRSVPVAGTKVDEAGNQDLVRQVCSNRREFGDQKGSFNAYVVFKDESSVPLALKANNRVLDSRHLRFDTATPSQFDPRRTVFVGSLFMYADEEALRNHIASVLTNGHDDIENVRIVRDPETLVGKGIAYILLKNRESVLKALELNQSVFKKRELRVTVCGKRTKRSNSSEPSDNKDSHKRSVSSTSDDNDDGEQDDSSSKQIKKARHRDRTEEEWREARSKSKSKSPEKGTAAYNAQKRIKLKDVTTRKKFLIANKQKKAQPGKKGKRLGGVIKRAMKAAKAK